jgi:hypothetical protein
MNDNRPTKTLADFMAMAINPALLILLVHSFCFFLVDVFYRGAAAGSTQWVLFWFVLAVVLITRIGIEQGDTQAATYGILLAVVTWFYLSVVQQSPVFGALLLALVWFTAHKLTVNCTLVDDDADASGQGLLQPLRQLPERLKSLAKGKTPETAAPAAAAPPPNPAPAAGRPGFPGLRPRPAPPPPETKKRKSSAQTPGVWLIYYSVAALPIFGLGQMLLPAGDMAARHRGFVHLFSYLAAALGLLVTTSFLGLRRYLRQRRVIMPGKIALGWLQYGIVGGAVILGAALLLPRPGAGEAWAGLRYRVDYQLRQASQYAARFNPHGRGGSKSGSQTPSGSQADNPSPPSGPAAGADQNQNPNAPGSTDQQPGSAPGGNAPAGGGGGTATSSVPAPIPPAGPLFGALKVLLYLAVAVGLCWLLFRYRAMILAVFTSLWAVIRNFVTALLALFRSRSAPLAATPKRPELPPFNTFKNPFITGADRIWSHERLIAYTYNALQSWALEAEAPASPQTAREFCAQLGGEMPDAAEALAHLAYLYGHVAYGASVPANYQPEHLHQIWEFLALPRQKAAPGAVVAGSAVP